MTEPKGSARKKRVRAAIEAAQPAQPSAAPAPLVQTGAPAYLAFGFEMRPEGLFRKDEVKDTRMWICAPFSVEAETRDLDGGNWGFLVSWRDRDGAVHEEIFPRSLFAGDCHEARIRLSSGGLSLNATRPARQAFVEYINIVAAPRRARTVEKIGWHQVEERMVFVLPGHTFGKPAERVVLQVSDGGRSLFNEAGTLDEWRSQIGRLCIGNSRLVFAVSCAFAAPLLHLVGEDCGGFNLRGDSRSGKSTALKVAASVCGGTPAAGAAGFLRSWRATANGLEGVASTSNDTLLPLDEISQVDGREVGETVYMLGNGQGKWRGARFGLGKPALRFNTLFLSTGEHSLAEKIAENGGTVRAGMEVRCCEIPADAGAGLGLFEALHGELNGDAFARELKRLVGQYYGTPLRTFLTRLTEELQLRGIGYADELRDRAAEQSRRLLASAPGATGQVASVGGKFALVALAGELASAWLITEWPAGEATAAVVTCFQAWLAERGTDGAREHAQAAAQLRAFISRHGAMRFERWTDSRPSPEQQSEATPGAPTDGFRTGNRAGWRRWIERQDHSWGWRYYLTSEGMNEALTGLAYRESTRMLALLGLIVPSQAKADREKNKLSGSFAVPGNGKIRLYQIADDILGDGDSQADAG
jgi:uncharacterized protein (DUF927 family)